MNDTEWIPSISKMYPNRVISASEDSKTIKQMNAHKGKGGVGFYCSKRHEYIFIEKTKI